MFLKCQFDDKCEAEFHSAIDAKKHYELVHNLPVVKYGADIITEYVPVDNYPQDSKEGERVLFKLFQYQPEKYCFLLVEEFSSFIRIYTVRLDNKPDGNEDFPVRITVPSPEEARKDKVCRITFCGILLPHDTLQGKMEDEGEYFEVNKPFWQKYAQQRDPADGKKYISVQFQFGEYSLETEG